MSTNGSRKQLTTYLKPETHAVVERLAAAQMRRVSDYLRLLILDDIRKREGEAAYEEALKLHAKW